MIKYMDFQFSTWCNRKCSFCPPQNHYRKDNVSEMTSEDFENIIKELKIGLSKGLLSEYVHICINRYWEPMSRMDLVNKYVARIREELPKSTIMMHTNGDYFNKENLLLIPDGLSSIKVNLYDMEYLDVILLIYEHFGKVKRDIDNDRHEITFTHNNIEWQFMWKKVDVMEFKNRGSVMLDIYSEDRVEECYIPKNAMVFEYEGTVMPCCDLYSKVPTHKDAIIGNILSDGFETIYNRLQDFNIKNSTGCSKCNATYKKIFGTDGPCTLLKEGGCYE